MNTHNVADAVNAAIYTYIYTSTYTYTYIHTYQTYRTQSAKTHTRRILMPIHDGNNYERKNITQLRHRQQWGRRETSNMLKISEIKTTRAHQNYSKWSETRRTSNIRNMSGGIETFKQIQLFKMCKISEYEERQAPS